MWRPLLDQSGPATRAYQCSVLGVKRTFRGRCLAVDIQGCARLKAASGHSVYAVPCKSRASAPGYLVRDHDRIYGDDSHYGHPRQAYRTSIALAERFCRTVDRVNPARVCGSYRGLGRGAFAPDLASLCLLLQQHPNAPITGQRCAGLSLCSADRNHHVISDSWRASSPLRSGLSFRYTHRARDHLQTFLASFGAEKSHTKSG